MAPLLPTWATMSVLIALCADYGGTLKLHVVSNLTSMTSRMNLFPLSMSLTLLKASTCSENDPWQAKTPTLITSLPEDEDFFSLFGMLIKNFSTFSTWGQNWYYTREQQHNINKSKLILLQFCFDNRCHNWWIEFAKNGAGAASVQWGQTS